MATAAECAWSSSIELTAEEYAKFSEFFYRRTGIVLGEKKKAYAERRIDERVRLTDSTGFRDYFALLRFQASGEELQKIINLLTVNETYFLREDYQFDALVTGILPEMVRGRSAGDAIRIWSVPCSTGEEPYSIAIHLLEKWQRADEFAIEIKASDIDSKVLHEAGLGVYGERSLQRVSPALRERYFKKIGFDRSEICRDIRDSVEFSPVNVTNPVHMSRFREIDVIFCRNMLIYFDDTSRREAVEAFYECLTPGGFICLGHSESMSRMSSLFLPRKFKDTIVYQKPAS